MHCHGEARVPYLLENFWKTFSGIPVCCYYLLFFQLDDFDQSRTSEENGIHSFFHCSLSFHHCQRGITFKDQYFAFLMCWNVKKRYVHFITRYNFINEAVSTNIQQLKGFFTGSDSFWYSARLWGIQRQTIFSYIFLHE